MKISLLKTIAAVAIPSMLAIGCGGSSNKTTISHDMAMKVTGGDMAVGAGCTTVAMWAADSQGEGAFNNSDDSTLDLLVYSFQQDADGQTYDILNYEYYSTTSTTIPTLPHAGTYTSSETYADCTDCAFLNVGTDNTGAGGEFYIAKAGTTSATKLDNTMPTGTISASGSNLHFVHWDIDQDSGAETADPDGKCIDVTAFSVSGMYDNSMPDM